MTVILRACHHARVRTFIVAAVMLAGAAGNNRFALGLYAQLRGANGNVIVSPFNVAEALAMVERGTSGETSRELRSVMHSDLPRAQSGVAWKALLADVDRSGVVSATALWSNGSVLRKAYAADAKKNFGATAQMLDFANANAAASRINAWVAYKTHNNIRSLISPESLSKDTRAVLTAAIWMKAAWATPFERRETRDRVFHLAGRDVKTPTMQQTTYLRYANANGVRLLELPYAAQGLTILVVLPDARFGLGAVEASLSSAAIERWTKALSDDEVALKLPRFTAASTFSLTASLQRLGVRRLFDRTRGAELSGMTTSAAPLSVSDVVHSARIIVDEEGTEASAATDGSTMATGTEPPPPPRPFIADHPFLYIIRSGDQILFIGRVVDPRA
jgi:serpin B